MTSKNIADLKKALNILCKAEEKTEKRLLKQAKGGNIKGMLKTRRAYAKYQEAEMLLDRIISNYYKRK